MTEGLSDAHRDWLRRQPSVNDYREEEAPSYYAAEEPTNNMPPELDDYDDIPVDLTPRAEVVFPAPIGPEGARRVRERRRQQAELQERINAAYTQGSQDTLGKGIEAGILTKEQADAIQKMLLPEASSDDDQSHETSRDNYEYLEQFRLNDPSQQPSRSRKLGRLAADRERRQAPFRRIN